VPYRAAFSVNTRRRMTDAFLARQGSARRQHLARGSEGVARAKLDAQAAADLDRLGQDRATP
jgi:hypothetical protein